MTTCIRLHPRLSKCKKCSKFECSVANHPHFDHIKIVQCTIFFAQRCVCPYHKKRFNKDNLHQIRHHNMDDHKSIYPLRCQNAKPDDYENTCIIQNNTDSDLDSIHHDMNEHTNINDITNITNVSAITQQHNSYHTSNNSIHTHLHCLSILPQH